MNKIIINDKEYVLSDELVEKIAKEMSLQDVSTQMPVNLFERRWDDDYFFISSYGVVYKTNDDGINPDNFRFNIANYCRDKVLMEQRALHETLNRLLWRYSEMHGGDAPWDGSHIHCMITYSIDKNKVDITSFWQKKMPGCVYFKDVTIAQAAIEEVVKPFLTDHPDFEW